MEERAKKKESERKELIEIEKEKFEFQLKMKELDLHDKIKQKTFPLGTRKTFDVTKHIRLVPPFQEKEVDKYFLHFIPLSQVQNPIPVIHLTIPVILLLQNPSFQVKTKVKIPYPSHFAIIENDLAISFLNVCL